MESIKEIQMKDLDENRFYVEKHRLRLVIQNDRKQISSATGTKRTHSFVLNTNRSEKGKHFGKEEIEKFIPVDFFPNALNRLDPFLTDLFEMVTFGGGSPLERRIAKSFISKSRTLLFDEKNTVDVESIRYFLFHPISLTVNVHTKHNNLHLALQ